jgi:hypothetical protein
MIWKLARSFTHLLPCPPMPKTLRDSESLEDCAICYKSVVPGTEVAVLPCSHWFHPICIDERVRMGNSCPYCRRWVSETEHGNESDQGHLSYGTIIKLIAIAMRPLLTMTALLAMRPLNGNDSDQSELWARVMRVMMMVIRPSMTMGVY